MSIYPEILKRVIANNLNTTFFTTPKHPEEIFNFTDETPNVVFTSLDTLCPGILQSSTERSSGIRDWMTLFTATRGLPYDEPIVYILVMTYLQKMNKTFVNELPDVATRCFHKFRILSDIYHDPFITDNICRNILSILQKTQCTYHAFSRLARVYRHKHTPVQINTDLYMNDLVPTHKNTFVLLDHDKIYYFSMNDLAKIMLDSLTYSYLFFPEPKVCKNPYNNMPFTKSTLYNMYFQMKESFCVVPRLIQLFFEADFNVFLFKKLNESTLLEHIIREYVARTEPIRMRADILKMVTEHDDKGILIIHPLFPSKSLFTGLKHIYILYLCRKYTADGKIYENYGHEIVYRMDDFINKNPRFGRMNFIKNSYIPNLLNPLPNPNPILQPDGSVIPFVFGRPAPKPVEPARPFTFLNTQNTQNTQNTSSDVSFSVNGVVLYHTNTASTPGYQEVAAYNRPPNIVQDFLENHQYDESAYNRYVYFGSTCSNDEPRPLPPSVTDAETVNHTPTPWQFQDNDSTDESSVQELQGHNNDAAETPEETHAANALVQLWGNSIRVMQYSQRNDVRNFVGDSPARLPITDTPPHTPVNRMTIYYDYHPNNESDDADYESTSTDEQDTARMNLEREFIIAGDNSSDALSVASSIDTDADYEDNDGYDSVS